MDLEARMDETDVIVIDMGSGVTKIGFCGEDAPRACVDTVTGQVLTATGTEGQDRQKKVVVGAEAYQNSEAELTQPVRRGMLDYKDSGNAVETLFQHAFSKVLAVEPEDFPLLILDAPTESKQAREWLGELLFEKFKVKSLSMWNTAVMSLFSTGKTRGLVLESGDGVTHAVPVYEGYAIPHAVFKLDCGGADITEELHARCVEAGIPGVAELDAMQQITVMRKMKEKLATCVPDYEKACDLPDPSDQEHRSFELPDGSIVQIPHDIRFGGAEVLFSHAGEETVQHVCTSALNTLDADFRSECMQNIVLAGGSTMIAGLPAKIKQEVQKILGEKVQVLTDSQRKNAAWIGGSMFASFSTFPHYEITKADYDEGKIDLKGLIAKKTF
ncbi:unnamed protein product [Amoebophrya sp. A25]|nr:unnamed protein product [Amoebophrya sp. A25]|eukprot:GSA25T00005992001.1